MKASVNWLGLSVASTACVDILIQRIGVCWWTVHVYERLCLVVSSAQIVADMDDVE